MSQAEATFLTGGLAKVFELDETNALAQRDLLHRNGLLDLLNRMPGLLEALNREIQDALSDDRGSIARTTPAGDLEPRYDTILRLYMALSVWQQFMMAAGHLVRGHVTEIFKHMRRAVEATAIAYRSKAEPELGDVFLSPDPGQMRERTKRRRLFPKHEVETDINLAHLDQMYGYSSEVTHNNFTSFATRVKNTMYVGKDDRLHFKIDMPIYDVEDENFILGITVWLLRGTWVCARVLSDAFSLPDCVWRRRMDAYHRDLSTVSEKLKPTVMEGWQRRMSEECDDDAEANE